MSRPFMIPAEGGDVNRSFVVPVHLPAGRYLRAAEFRPGNPRVVHHGTAMLDSSGRARQPETQQEGMGGGYVSFGGPGFIPSGGLPGYAPAWGRKSIPRCLGHPAQRCRCRNGNALPPGRQSGNGSIRDRPVFHRNCANPYHITDHARGNQPRYRSGRNGASGRGNLYDAGGCGRGERL